MKLSIVLNNDIPAFGAWHCPPPDQPVENGTVLLNVEACFGELVGEDDQPVQMGTEERKRLVIETLMHEFGHALESHFCLPPNEEAIEAAIMSWQSKLLRDGPAA